MEVSEHLIREIVHRILGVSEPKSIILFGSAAAGRMGRDSDIDILIIEAQPENTRQESVRISNALRGLGFSFDVIVMASERFEETKNIIGGIAYPANKYGRVIYAAA